MKEVSAVTLQDTANEIRQLVDTWRSRFESLSEKVVHSRPTEQRWSIAEVVGHLIDSANNNHQRFVRAQFCDELVFPKYEQNQWVEVANYQDSNWPELVQFWYLYNLHLASLIESMNKDKLDTLCTIIPYETCSLGFLVMDYLDHLKHHLTIVQRRIESDDPIT